MRFFIGLGILALCLTSCDLSNLNPSIDEGEVHNHEWGETTYTWAEDFLSCKAERICLLDETHVERETANSTYSVIKEATCENSGLGRFEVSFINPDFKAQSKEKTIDSLGHDYKFDSFVWTGFTAQAKYVCSHDRNHVKLYDATITSEITTPATCEVNGVRTYKATYDAHTDTKTELIPAINHNWGNVTYNWSGTYENGYTCKAIATCLNDNNHTFEEVGIVTITITEEPTCEDNGTEKCVATFKNSLFSEGSIHYVNVPALGHDFIEHKAVAPTCEEDGTIRYFECSRCHRRVDGSGNELTNVVDPATGHDWEEVSYFSYAKGEMTAYRCCKNDDNHEESETVEGTYEVISYPTRTQAGLARYTYTFENPAFESQTEDVVLPYGSYPDLSNDGNTLIYGLYPQTHVSDQDLIELLEDLPLDVNGWRLYNNEYYVSAYANTYQSSNDYKFDDGEAISNYHTYWFKCEPISWRVLNSENDEYYVMSNVLLDTCQYSSRNNNNYENSTVRDWLNDSFLNKAFYFTDEFILETEVDNSAATTDSTTNQFACDNTEDKLFLFSYRDYLNADYGFSTGSSSSETRLCKATDYARVTGAYSNDDGYGHYWTRSPNSGNKNYASHVRTDGSIHYDNNTSYKYLCARPGATIKLLNN